MKEDSHADRWIKYSKLNTINQNFISAASLYAKVQTSALVYLSSLLFLPLFYYYHSLLLFLQTIVSEMFLDPKHRSIQLSETGGLAGGIKYKWRNIMFKVASGSTGKTKSIYQGSDEAAMKAMGNFVNIWMHFALFASSPFPSLPLTSLHLIISRSGAQGCELV